MATKVLKQNNKYLVEHRKEGFDKSKFEVVGNPTIAEDGLASVKDIGTAIIPNYIFNPLSADFEVRCAIRITEDIVTSGISNQVILSMYTLNGTNDAPCSIQPAAVVGSGNTYFYFKTDGETGTIVISIPNPIDYNYDDIIYYKVGRKGTTYYASLQLNSSSPVEKTVVSTEKTPENIYKFVLGTWGIPFVNNLTYRFNGLIDLKSVAFGVGGKEIFNGQKDKYYALQT